MVVNYHEPEWHAEKLVCCLRGQGHSEGLCNENMTISTIVSKLLICLLATNFSLIVHHHKSGYLVENY